MTLLESPAMRCVIWAVAAGALAAAGCHKKSQGGLPPSSEWQTAQAAGSAPAVPEPDEPIPHFTPPPGMIGMGDPSNPHAGLGMSGASNPHAGLDMSGASNPHAGLDMSGASNPHAGLDMSGASNPHAGLDMSSASNPHAGLDMNGDGEPDNPHGTDVTRLGLEAPDPDRPIDPSHRVAGAITVDPKAGAKLTPGTSVFLTVKRAGPDGAPSGPPLAVDKLTWTGDGMAFELTEAQAMVAGTDLSGDVVVMARYDQDSDAGTKQPGDVTGQVRVKLPAEHVKLTLDTVLP